MADEVRNTTSLNRLRELAEAAPAGPWNLYCAQSGTVTVMFAATKHTNRHGPGWKGANIIHYNISEMGLGEDQSDREKMAAGAYLAAVSPDVILALLDRLAIAEARHD